MRIAIDKNTLKAFKKNNNEYVYLFDNESLDNLLKLNLHCVYYKHCDFVDINLTNYDIDCYKKTTINEKDYDKLDLKGEHKIGIIIPNYNYADCLTKCFDSILSQTYQNFEIVFVDDVSEDNSIELVKSIQAQHPNKIKLVELKQKRYNGGARNEGYLHLSNDVDYVFCIDSDDWLYDKYVLEKINKKLHTSPDVLFIGLAQCKNGITKSVFIPQYQSRYEAIKGWSGCGKVIKKSLAMAQKCLYNEGTLKEDRNQHCKICIYMGTFALLKEPAYVWNRDNINSVTTIRDKIVWGTSTIRHYADTMQLALSVKGKDKQIDDYLESRLSQCKQEMDMGMDRQW